MKQIDNVLLFDVKYYMTNVTLDILPQILKYRRNLCLTFTRSVVICYKRLRYLFINRHISWASEPDCEVESSFLNTILSCSAYLIAFKFLTVMRTGLRRVSD